MVVQVFDGQPKVEDQQYVRDPGTVFTMSSNTWKLAYEDAESYKNARFFLAIFDNTHAVQNANGIGRSDSLHHVSDGDVRYEAVDSYASLLDIVRG